MVCPSPPKVSTGRQTEFGSGGKIMNALGTGASTLGRSVFFDSVDTPFCISKSAFCIDWTLTKPLGIGDYRTLSAFPFRNFPARNPSQNANYPSPGSQTIIGMVGLWPVGLRPTAAQTISARAAQSNLRAKSSHTSEKSTLRPVRLGPSQPVGISVCTSLYLITEGSKIQIGNRKPKIRMVGTTSTASQTLPLVLICSTFRNAQGVHQTPDFLRDFDFFDFHFKTRNPELLGPNVDSRVADFMNHNSAFILQPLPAGALWPAVWR